MSKSITNCGILIEDGIRGQRVPGARSAKPWMVVENNVVAVVLMNSSL